MSGSGRGRAWLRLGQNANPLKPGIEPNTNDISPSSEEKIKPTSNNYNDLLEKFQIFSVDDDGIALNNKIYHVRSEFMTKCPNINLISEAVEAIHEQCLIDEDLAQKFIVFITSAHFVNKQKSKEEILWRDTIRRTFITLSQKDFEAVELYREKFPTKFYNAVRLCSDYFYNLAKLLKTNMYPSVEKISTLGYLRFLLKYNDPKDISLILHLVCQHSFILSNLPKDETAELLDKIKLKLIRAPQIESQRMRLFLVYELLLHKYHLTDDQLEFYHRNMSPSDYVIEVLPYLNRLQQSQAISNMNGSDNWKKTDQQNSHISEGNPVKKIFPQQLSISNFKLSDENTSSTPEELVARSGSLREPFTHQPNEPGQRWGQDKHTPNQKENLKDHPSDPGQRWGQDKHTPNQKENLKDHPSEMQERIGIFETRTSKFS